MFIFSFFLNVASMLLSLVAKLILPPEVPLFYGLPQTTEQLVPSLFVAIPSLVSIILTVINVLISINVEGVYLKKTLAFTTLLISILAAIASLKIIFLVGSI